MIQLVETLEELRALRPAWDELYAASGAQNPFVTSAWLERWAEHLADRFVAVVRRAGPGAPLDAAVLLDRHARHWCTPTRESYFGQILVRPGATPPLRAFVARAFLSGRARRVILHRAPDTAEFRASLGRALGPLRALVVERESPCTRWIDLGGGFEAYLAGRPAKVRQELRRKERAFVREAPGAELVELAGGGGLAGVEAAMAAIAHVEEDSWKETEHTSIAANPRERAFYAALFGLGGPELRTRLFLLRRPAGAVAYVIGVEHQGVFHALKTSYRADHARLSPGQVIFFRLLERLAGEGRVARVELLGTDQRWKKELATHQRDEVTFEILRPDPLGAAIALVHRHRHRPQVARTLEALRKVRARFTPPP